MRKVHTALRLQCGINTLVNAILDRVWLAILVELRQIGAFPGFLGMDNVFERRCLDLA